MIKKADQFNVLIVGTGGQGLITLLQVLAEAAVIEGYDVKTSELHGLSQRGGSVEVHIRFGKKIYAPLIPQGKANLIIGLEMQEVLKSIYFANSKTKLLLNKHIVPIPLVKNLTAEEILKALKVFGKNLSVVAANEICQKELNKAVVAGMYLLSLSSYKGLIPLKPASILKAIKKTIPEKYLELNLKVFELARKS